MKFFLTVVSSVILVSFLGPLPALAESSADLTISVSPSQSPIVADSPVTFNVQVSNNGPGTAARTEVYDRLPPDVIFGSASGSGIYAPSKDRVHWSVGSLAPSGTLSEW